ncbi:MAG TPA: hypothetical protein VFM77_16570 [Terriglobales bacterium]|nr:hypothetical protein [Terriglobales bacterium]
MFRSDHRKDSHGLGPSLRVNIRVSIEADQNSLSVFPNQFGADGYFVTLNVQLSLITPNSPRTKRFEAIIDSGATRCLFDWSIGDFLGIDRSKCKVEKTSGIGGIEQVYVHEVLLHIPGGAVTITAGFKEKLPVAGLLGMTGFFEHFRVTFDTVGKVCELERIFHA